MTRLLRRLAATLDRAATWVLDTHVDPRVCAWTEATKGVDEP